MTVATLAGRPEPDQMRRLLESEVSLAGNVRARAKRTAARLAH